MKHLHFYSAFTIILFLSFFQSSCTFFKGEKEHQLFVEEKLKKLFNQKSIFQPTSKSDIDYQNYQQLKFIGNMTSKRTYDGTFLTKVTLYETFYNTESCQIPYPGMPGYVYRDRYGSRLISILKRPAGTLNIRTAFDGEVIYLINVENEENEESLDKKSSWPSLFVFDLPCR
jgi:hypothetical protein